MKEDNSLQTDISFQLSNDSESACLCFLMSDTRWHYRYVITL